MFLPSGQEIKLLWEQQRPTCPRPLEQQSMHSQKIPSPCQDTGNTWHMVTLLCMVWGTEWHGIKEQHPPPNDQVLCLTRFDVWRTLLRVFPQKAARPDFRGDQLADVLRDIFNISLSTTDIPICFKANAFIPVPMKSSVSCLSVVPSHRTHTNHQEVLWGT